MIKLVTATSRYSTCADAGLEISGREIRTGARLRIHGEVNPSHRV
jgi:hypothetical protein